MRKLILIVAISITAFAAIPNKAVAQVGDYANYVGALDTVDGTSASDTTAYDVTVKGKKHCVSISVDQLKISGTVSGTIKVFGSVNGTTYLTTPLTTLTITDGSNNYGVSYSFNGYKKYRILITAATGKLSQRTFILYRE